MRKEKSILNISSTSKDGIQVGTGQSFYVYEIIFRDAPDIRPDNPAFFYIQYPVGYRI
jgi:hypothetical protein